jgi:hypothetical protein
MTILQGRDPREVVDFLDGAGVLWRPGEVGLTDENVAQTVATLHDHCVNEEFYYTVVNRLGPDETVALRILRALTNL